MRIPLAATVGLCMMAACAADAEFDGTDDATPDAAAGSSSSSGNGPSGSSSSGGMARDASAAPCSGPKPGPTNTGVPVGTTLTPSGSIEVFDDGAVVEDSEIIGTNGNVTAAISFENYTARRLDIHGCADGLKANANVLIEDCWIHDLSNGEGEHNDAVQSTGGKGVTIRHNSLSGASNACVQTGDEGDATEDLTVQCNWLAGGGYSLNIRGTGETTPKNTRVLDNTFARDSAYGPWTIDDPAPTVTGNVYEDGTPIVYE